VTIVGTHPGNMIVSLIRKAFRQWQAFIDGAKMARNSVETRKTTRAIPGQHNGARYPPMTVTSFMVEGQQEVAGPKGGASAPGWASIRPMTARPSDYVTTTTPATCSGHTPPTAAEHTPPTRMCGQLTSRPHTPTPPRARLAERPPPPLDYVLTARIPPATSR